MGDLEPKFWLCSLCDLEQVKLWGPGLLHSLNENKSRNLLRLLQGSYKVIAAKPAQLCLAHNKQSINICDHELLLSGV